MSIKRLNPNAVFRVVSGQDDAIVFEHDKNEQGESINSNYEKFLETLDLADLKLKTDGKPTVFQVRPLTNLEMAEINNRYVTYDPVAKTINNKNRQAMLVEIFNTACIGVEDDTGKVSKVSADEFQFSVVLEIAGIVNHIGALGKNLKKA